MASCTSVHRYDPARQCAGSLWWSWKCAHRHNAEREFSESTHHEREFPTYTSTVTFTLTGGAQGTYTISENAHGASDTPSQLMMLFRDHSGKEFNMTLNEYKGPGSYTLMPQNAIPSDQLEIGLSDQTSWDLVSVVATLPAGSSLSQVTCAVTIASDAPVASAVIGGLHRLKGSFSCPKLAATPVFQQAAPITVTNGQLDVYFQFLSR